MTEKLTSNEITELQHLVIDRINELSERLVELKSSIDFNYIEEHRNSSLDLLNHIIADREEKITEYTRLFERLLET